MAVTEGLVINGLDLNDQTTYVLEELDLGNAPKRFEWATGADADGALLVRDPLTDTRTITARVRVVRQASMDAAINAVAILSDKIEECEQQPDGSAVVWTPANSTTKALTFYALAGQMDPVPITISGADAGYFVLSPVVTIHLFCKPYGYEAEVLYGTSTTSTDILPTLVVSGVPGDVPAEARLVVTDLATQSRRHVEWGLEWRYYNAATSLVIDSDNMVTSGFAGTGTTRTGAYDPGAAGNSVIRATVLSVPIAVCGTGNLSHVGTFRVKGRVYFTTAGFTTPMYVRLSWRDGDGPLGSNDWVSPVVRNDWVEVDLGLVTIQPAKSGTQRWTGQIEAYGTTGDTLDVDVLQLLPCSEGYGKSTAPSTYTSGVAVGYDQFSGFTSGALSARVAPAGGTWATSGATGDFTGANLGTTGGGLTRTTTDTGPRWAILGATNYTDTEVRVSSYVTSGSGLIQGVVARWTDSSNYLRAYVSSGNYLTIEKVVAGTVTTLATGVLGYAGGEFTLAPGWVVRLTVYQSGRWVAAVLSASSGATYTTLSGSDAVLATGGTLQTGKPGIIDQAGGGSRFFDDFFHSVPAAEPIALYSGRTAEFRFDGAIRQDASGTYAGPPPAYRGARCLLPPAGDQNRSARLAVKARRNNVDEAADSSITDNTKLEVYYRARHANVRTT